MMHMQMYKCTNRINTSFTPFDVTVESVAVAAICRQVGSTLLSSMFAANTHLNRHV